MNIKAPSAAFGFVAVVAVVLLCGCASGPEQTACSGDLCVELYDSTYAQQACGVDSKETCLFATVQFKATDKGEVISNPADLEVALQLNDRNVGVEGTTEVSKADSELVVQLLLDRSFSITESGSTNAVRSSATAFIAGLPDAAKIRMSAFASEDYAPVFLGGDCSNNGFFVDKTVATKIIAECYVPYAAPTSNSQTKLYDAVANIGPGLRGAANVLVVFTDGSDTASTNFKTAADAREQARSNSPGLKIYAIGLGEQPGEEDLKALSDDNFYRANDTSGLESVFSEVSKQITSIHVLKALVASRESEAQARLTVTHQGRTVEHHFVMDPF